MKPKTPLPWSVGRVLDTPTTRRFDPETRAQYQERESRLVFSNFSPEDRGTGRSAVAEFRFPEDAAFVADLVDRFRWMPIETAPEATPVLVCADRLHRGLPSAEVVVIHRAGTNGEVHYWTNGGPNAGSDIEFEIPPTYWMPLPPLPEKETP